MFSYTQHGEVRGSSVLQKRNRYCYDRGAAAEQGRASSHRAGTSRLTSLLLLLLLLLLLWPWWWWASCTCVTSPTGPGSMWRSLLPPPPYTSSAMVRQSRCVSVLAFNLYPSPLSPFYSKKLQNWHTSNQNEIISQGFQFHILLKG